MLCWSNWDSASPFVASASVPSSGVLSALPPDDVAAALQEVKIHDWTLARLPGAALEGHLEQADFGNRLTLELSYGAPVSAPPGDRSPAGLKRKSVTLESWIAPAAQKSDSPSAEDAS